MPTTGADSPGAWRRGGCEITTDPDRIDLAKAHGWIANESYWAAGIPWATFERAARNCLAFGVLEGGETIGFARVVTDRATYAYLCDVWIDSARRGRGLGRWLVHCILGHPDLQGLRRFALVTRNAHSLYAPHGFKAMPDPARYLERHDPEAYR
jgi:GNAT superfamily N-acetyltransferase